ncbi:hypothetical protein FNF27_01014 [Cafeteria roenbergensis]|uniref:TRUD domain-containing protein n=1 Tax=Cafeteria roenbergensis TaxID=33653 RepID=A0A5A8EIW0_CAFRO|nr:hypothetical protein FNF27_01014 [Cafeteria roenbergensis]
MRGVNVSTPAPALPAFAKRLVETGSPEEAAFLGFDAFVVPSDEATAWTGTIKSTVHDFHVREVSREHGNPAGVPVRLTELAPEVEDVVGDDAERGNWRGFEWADFEDPAARDAALTEIAPMLGPGGGESLVAFLKAPSESRDRRGVRAVLVADKVQRRRLHELAKTALPCVETSTDVVPADKARAMGLEVPDSAVDEATGEVRVLKLAIRRRSMTRQRRWPRDIPPYTRFVLHKQGEDHASAIALLCRATGRTPRTFSGAGVKDRWAVTVQAMSAYHVWPDELARVNRFSPTVRVGNCEPSAAEVTLGKLWGNEFCIVVRDVAAPAAAAAAAVTGTGTAAAAAGGPLPPQCAPAPANASPEAVAAARAVSVALSRWAAADYRFVNYFGSQRFGTFPVRTHEVGVAMLRGEFAAASCMVLGFRPEEAEEYLAALGIGLDEAADPSQGVETEEEEEEAAGQGQGETTLAAAIAEAAAELEEDDYKPPKSSSSSSSSSGSAPAKADDGAAAAAPALSTSQLAKAERRAEEWRALPKRERIARRILGIVRRRMADRANRAAPDAVLQRRWVAPQELAVVEALATYHPNNTVMPVVAVPKGSRMMFLHAVQSWVFNHAASERVRRLGMAPVAGDLVLDKEALAAAGIDPDSVESGAGASTLRGEEDGDLHAADDDAAAATDTDGGDATPAVSEAESDQATAAAEQAKARKLLAEEGLPPVRVLSQEDVDSGKWTIDDVVLALPGKNVTYSQHECGAPLAVELLARLGLSDPRLEAIAAAGGDAAAIEAANSGPCLWGGSGSPVVRCSMGDMTGAYRSLVARAGEAGFSVQWYDKAPGARIPQAVQSDVDLLDAAAMQQTAASLSSSSSTAAAAADAAAPGPAGAQAPVPEMQAPWPCVVLRLRLRQGVYATMAMREAMRGDPAVSAAPVGVFARNPATSKRGREDAADAPDSKRARAPESETAEAERA